MGVLEDTTFIMTTALAAAITLGLGYFALTSLVSFSEFSSTTADIVIQNFVYLDAIFILGLVLLFSASIILAYLLPTSPAFFFTFILVGFVAFILAPVYSNVYATIATNSTLGSSFDQFPLTAIAIGNLPIISFILSGMIALISYGKKASSPNIQDLI